jgi:guanine deaminase
MTSLHGADLQEDSKKNVLYDLLPTPLSVEEALYLATRGGAQMVDLADRIAIGGFEVGMFWDAQLIELGPAADVNNVDLFGWESWPEKGAK